jgi:hypothetical protein
LKKVTKNLDVKSGSKPLESAAKFLTNRSTSRRQCLSLLFSRYIKRDETAHKPFVDPTYSRGEYIDK